MNLMVFPIFSVVLLPRSSCELRTPHVAKTVGAGQHIHPSLERLPANCSTPSTSPFPPRHRLTNRQRGLPFTSLTFIYLIAISSLPLYFIFNLHKQYLTSPPSTPLHPAIMAECSTGRNPLAQMSKLGSVDNSLQRERNAAGLPLSQQNLRSAGPSMGVADAQVLSSPIPSSQPSPAN